MEIIYGSKIAINKRTKQILKIENLYNKLHKKPKLAIVLVGNNPASLSYVGAKKRACAKVGLDFDLYHLDENTTEDVIKKLISDLNKDSAVNGILVQLPLPKHLDSEMIIDLIDPIKDVDGLNSINAGKLVKRKEALFPCTALGIIELLNETKINLEGKHLCMIGRSNLVGLPAALLALNKNMTVTICHSKTKNLKAISSSADIVVVAIGKAKFINKDYLKKDAIVIDVGINRLDDSIVGDVDFEDVKDIVSYITPVPKGVGPMTISALIDNTIKAMELQNGL